MPFKEPNYKRVIAFGSMIYSLYDELPRVMSCVRAKQEQRIHWLIASKKYIPPEILSWEHAWKDSSGKVVLKLGRSTPPNDIVLRFPGFADYYLNHEVKFICAVPQGNTPREDLAMTMLGQVVPLCLAGLGRLVMHASAVKWGHGAVAFVGASGSGKSTLAAALANAGHALLADDGVALMEEHTRYTMPAGVTTLRLLPESAEHLRLTGFEKTWTLTNGKSVYSPTPVYKRKNRLPRLIKLKRIYFLDPKPDAQTRIQELSAGSAVERTLKQLFRIHTGGDEDVQWEFHQVCSLVEKVPCRLLSHPHTWRSLPGLLNKLEKDMDGV